MKIIEILREDRRNPEQNPKISTLHQLKNIVAEHGNDNVFVTFCKIDKFGIYPSSSFTTPIGICSYPIQYVIDLGLKVPYPKDINSRKYFLYIFKPNNPSKILSLQNSKPSLQMLAQSVHEIIPYVDPEDVSEAFEEYSNKYSYARSWWYSMYHSIDPRRYPLPIIREAYYGAVDSRKTNQIGLLTRKILMNMGYQGVRDDGEGIIHRKEPSQAVFFDTTDLSVIDHITNFPKDAMRQIK